MDELKRARERMEQAGDKLRDLVKSDSDPDIRRFKDAWDLVDGSSNPSNLDWIHANQPGPMTIAKGISKDSRDPAARASAEYFLAAQKTWRHVKAGLVDGLELIEGGFAWKGIAHDLEARPLDILAALMDSRHQRVDAKDLLDRWNDEGLMSPSTVNKHVSILRNALRAAWSCPDHDPLPSIGSGQWKLAPPEESSEKSRK